MRGRVVMLVLLLVCVATDGAENAGQPRMPSCPETEIMACTMNMAPVCGSDGNTYPNECALCVERQMKNVEILVVKENSC